MRYMAQALGAGSGEIFTMDSWWQRLQYTGKSFAVVVDVSRSSFCPQIGHINHPRFVLILPQFVSVFKCFQLLFLGVLD